MVTREKRTKLQKLVAVFDRFHNSLMEMSGDTAIAFVANWRTYRSSYIDAPPGVKPSQLAAGLEQGLRELSSLIHSRETVPRVIVSQALHDAIHAEYPEFLKLQDERMSKILARQRISTESEFMLVRHVIDVAEGQPARSGELSSLYRLIDAFECKGRRGA